MAVYTNPNGATRPAIGEVVLVSPLNASQPGRSFFFGQVVRLHDNGYSVFVRPADKGPGRHEDQMIHAWDMNEVAYTTVNAGALRLNTITGRQLP